MNSNQLAILFFFSKFNVPESVVSQFKHSEKILIGSLTNVTLALDIELEWYLYVSPLCHLCEFVP